MADQQESAEAAVGDRPALPPDGRVAARLKRLELARADVAHRMETALVPAHRELLRVTLAALDDEIEHNR